MSTEFDVKMDAIKREIKALKQGKERSANTLKTKEYTVNLSFDLEIHTYLIQYVRSKLMAVVDIDTSGLDPLMSIEFNINSLDSRIIRATPKYNSVTGHIGYLIYLYSNNQNDLDRLNNGETVTINYTANIKSTAELNISTTYQNLWVY